VLFAALASGKPGRKNPPPVPSAVKVTLPSGRLLKIRIRDVLLSAKGAVATVRKDAGDDPDITHKALIVTSVEFLGMNSKRTGVRIVGGTGVGVVTKPGLKIAPGRSAINPVPLSMIRRAVSEAAAEAGVTPSVAVTVSVPGGVELAGKTMNERLGIIGGISILGTTGIVEPMSLGAYRHSIACAISVAIAGGADSVVLSTGRSTEKVLEARRGLRGRRGLRRAGKVPPEAFILTGDHMGFALREAAGQKGLRSVTVAGQFGKFSKLAAGHFETHCLDSKIDIRFIASLCSGAGAAPSVVGRVLSANTARHAFFMLRDEGLAKVFKELSRRVKANSAKLVGPAVKVNSVLVGYDGEIVSSS
jgi:cobalt-precorrin-5B (C1)-methyltransferase